MFEGRLDDALEGGIGRGPIRYARTLIAAAFEYFQHEVDCRFRDGVHRTPPGFRCGNRRSAEVAGPIRLLSCRNEVGEIMRHDGRGRPDRRRDKIGPGEIADSCARRRPRGW